MAVQNGKDESLDSAIDNVFDLNNEKPGAPQSQHTIGEEPDDDGDDLDEGENAAPQGARNNPPDADNDDNVDEEGNLLKGLPEGFKEKPLKNDKGQIVDKNGKVLAATRQDKQLLHNYNRLRHSSDKLLRNNQELVKRVQEQEKTLALTRQLGLNNDQHIEALQLRAAFEKDPISAVRDVVARVLAQGYTAEQLFGPDAVGGINTAAMQHMMDQKMRPLTERFAAQEREEAISRKSHDDYTSFVTKHEYAETHGNEIASLMQERGLDPEKAYMALEVFAAKNRLDFSQPLQPQVIARIQQHRRRNPNSQGMQRRAPATPGSTRSLQREPASRNDAGSTNVNLSWDDIVGGVMSSQ